MFNFIKKYKMATVIAIGLFLFLIFFMPYIINKLYYITPPTKFFNVDYDNADLLDYYGNLLVFIGTILLGIISIYQTHQNQLKTDKVNQLTLELQKKSMEMDEERYKKEEEEEKQRLTPIFEIKNSHANGYYSNLNIKIKNIGVASASGIEITMLFIYVNGMLYQTINDIKSNATYLASGEETTINLCNKVLQSDEGTRGGLKNARMELWFKCCDVKGNLHGYSAVLTIADSDNFEGNVWTTEAKK